MGRWEEDEAGVGVEDEMRDVKYRFSGTRTSDARWEKCWRRTWTARASALRNRRSVGRSRSMMRDEKIQEATIERLEERLMRDHPRVGERGGTKQQER